LSSDAADVFDELDGLDELREAFPTYLFWQEELPGHIRYVARSRYLDASPHTVVTAEVDELEQALRLARRNGSAKLAIPPGQPTAALALVTAPPHLAADDGGTIAVPRSLIIAGRELMTRTAELPSSKRGLVAFLDDYRQLMFQIAVQNNQP
jgi:hypothetical protein